MAYSVYTVDVSMHHAMITSLSIETATQSKVVTMIYITTNDKGHTLRAATIEGALCHAVTMIYMGDKARQDARQVLSQGKIYTAVYGFKTVTIEPIPMSA